MSDLHPTGDPAPDLSGRTILVAGGSGNVGEAIVRRLRDAGAAVVVPTRRPAETAALLGDGVRVLEGSLGTAADAARLRDAISHDAVSRDALTRDADNLDGVGLTDVIASIGAWWSGAPVGQLDPAEYDRVIASRLMAHLHTANTFLPLLAGSGVPDPTYTFINGGAATAPVPGSGLVSVSAAGQLMLGRVVAAEQADGPVAVTTLVVATPVLSRDRPEGRRGWLQADTIGAVCAALVGGARLGTVVTLTDEASARSLVP